MALGCSLVTLHSGKWTTAAKTAQRLPSSVDLIALDVPDPTQMRLPTWSTSRLLAGSIFAYRADLSAKRNLGLVLSRLVGWSRVLFLDDDITELKPGDIWRASGLLDTFNAVGLHIGGFPDHSVVTHAFRLASGSVQPFIGGKALVVRTEGENSFIPSFFPEIYHNDWFFLLDGKSLQPVTTTGQVRQKASDPFRTPSRARAEELGDVLSEGVYWLLDDGSSILKADQAFWAIFLAKRRKFVERVLTMVEGEDIEPEAKIRKVASLKASRGRLARITPELCAKFLKAWSADRQRWQRYIQKLPTDQSVSLFHPGCSRLVTV